MESVQLKVALLDGTNFNITRTEEDFEILKRWFSGDSLEGLPWDDGIHIKEFGLLNRKFIGYIQRINLRQAHDLLSSKSNII